MSQRNPPRMLEWKLGFDFLSSVSMDRTTNCDVFNSTSWGVVEEVGSTPITPMWRNIMIRSTRPDHVNLSTHRMKNRTLQKKVPISKPQLTSTFPIFRRCFFSFLLLAIVFIFFYSIILMMGLDPNLFSSKVESMILGKGLSFLFQRIGWYGAQEKQTNLSIPERTYLR